MFSSDSQVRMEDCDFSEVVARVLNTVVILVARVVVGLKVDSIAFRFGNSVI